MKSSTLGQRTQAFHRRRSAVTVTTAAEFILADMNTIVSAVVSGRIPDTLLFAPRDFEIIAQSPVGIDNQMTIPRSFLANNPYIRNIDHWYRLTGAGAGGTNRALLPPKSRRPRGRDADGFRAARAAGEKPRIRPAVPGRVGGVKVYQPAAMRYADFTTA